EAGVGDVGRVAGGEGGGGGREEGREDGGDRRTRADRVDEFGALRGEERDAAAAAVGEDEADAARRADARDGGRWKGDCDGPGYLAEPAVQTSHDDVGGEPLRRTLVPRLEGDEVERAVRGVDEAQQAEADHPVVA